MSEPGKFHWSKWRCTACNKDCMNNAGASDCCKAGVWQAAGPPVPHRWPATIGASDLLVWQLEAAINGQPIEDYNVLIDLKDQIQRARK